MPSPLRRLMSAALLFGFAWPYTIGAQSNAGSQQVDIEVNTRDPGTPFPHFWEEIFGSGRAVLALRDSYREDLRTVRDITEFDAVRFHGIFMDDVGLYDPNATTQNPGQAVQAAQTAQSPTGLGSAPTSPRKKPKQ